MSAHDHDHDAHGHDHGAHDHDHDHEAHDHGAHGHAPGMPDLSVVASPESPTLRRLEVTVPVARVRRAYDRAYRDIAKSARVKGFRPGKVPRPVLERMFGA